MHIKKGVLKRKASNLYSNAHQMHEMNEITLKYYHRVCLIMTERLHNGGTKIFTSEIYGFQQPHFYVLPCSHPVQCKKKILCDCARNAREGDKQNSLVVLDKLRACQEFESWTSLSPSQGEKRDRDLFRNYSGMRTNTWKYNG